MAFVSTVRRKHPVDVITWLDPRHPNPAQAFPPLQLAQTEPNGLLAAGGQLSVDWLLAAYERGIFPWYSPGDPILWWSPSPRMVLFPDELHVSRSLEKVLRNTAYEIRFDTAFSQVMLACAATPRPGQDGTWITPEVMEGYSALHERGIAHSAECWMDGELVGGLYGVALGKMFYGESMFAWAPDASKRAFVHLVRWLKGQGFGMIDCQMHTAHLARFGAREIERDQFIATLKSLTLLPGLPGPWSYQWINPR